MADLSEAKNLAMYRTTNKVRFVTAASLFGGHSQTLISAAERRLAVALGKRLAMTALRLTRNPA